MKKTITIWLLMMAAPLMLFAQKASVSGRIIGHDDKEPLERATVQLLRTDTTFVSGTISDEHGAFALSNLQAGSFLLRISNLGYKTLYRTVNLQKNKPLALSDIILETETVELAEATIAANIPKMIVKDDTIVYNADAFRVPEGSVIEALVEAFPGAKIDDNGAVTINGKSVKRFKMDGRDYMTGNNTAVMKNLPSYLIDKVKAYEEKSDLAKMTGIDDGNDDFVLEFETKRSMRKGLQMNPDVGIGTNGRYGIRLTAMKPLGAMRYTFMGNANNVNDRNFSGRGGRGRGNSNGQQHAKSGALDVSYENNKDLKLSSRVTWNHRNTDNWSRTGSENFVNTRGGAFSNSTSQSYGRSNSWTGNMNLQWKIDTVTTLSFRPDASFSTSDNRSFSHSASFNNNPFDYVDDALTSEAWQHMNDLGLIVNSRQNKGLSYSSNHNASANLQLHRRLNSKGRNAAISTNVSYRDGSSRNASLSAVHLYQVKDRFGNDSTYQTNRYTATPSNSFNYSIGATYTEPLIVFKPKPDTTAVENEGRGSMRRGPRQRTFGTQGLFLQLNYRFSHSHQKNDPATYDFPDYTDDAFLQVLNDYREWTRLFGFLDNPYESYLSDRLSRFSERTEDGHNADLQLRFVREKYNMNVGVNLQPQHSHYIQNYLGRPVDTTRTVTNISPTLNLRYRFNQQTNLQVNFRGSSSQPSITQLLDIYDDTNPLNISMGNPGLKPSFTSNLSANFQMQRRPVYVEDSLGFQVPRQQRHWSFSTNASYSRTNNSIGTIVTYNEATGGRISRPENINGNWSANGGVTFNMALDTLNRWDVSGSLRGNYNHHIGYVNLNRTAVPDRNVTHTVNLSPDFSLSFRNKWLNASLNVRTTYAHTENRLQATRNLTTWNHSYGFNTGIKLPWGTNINTDIHMYSKRGYSDQTLNTNELIWNAQISQSFLRGRKLTVMLQWYDILNRQTNFSRTVNANGWTDREVNTITSYAMLHVSYRLNLFKGGSSRRDREAGGPPEEWRRPDGEGRQGGEWRRGGGGPGSRGGGRPSFPME